MELWDVVLKGLKDREDCQEITLEKYCNKVHKAFRKVFSNKKVPSFLIINRKLRKQLQSLKSGDQVIISAYTDLALFHAVRCNVRKSVGIHLWMWNPVESKVHFAPAIKQLRRNGFQLHTFDKHDAKKYQMTYHSSFFNMYIPMRQREIEYDFFFVGAVKNRGEKIQDIRDALKDFKCLFVVPSAKNEFISYAECLANIERSLCIVEILQEGQYDMTLRPFEALAFNKKLLTNNKHITEHPFYHPQNIFIYGVDDISTLDLFLQAPLHQISPDIIKQYDINTWIDSF